MELLVRRRALLRRSIVAVVATGLSVASCGAPNSPDAPVSPDRRPPPPRMLGVDAPPNILFLLADDMRFDAAGNKVIQTPTLDALAQQGVLFKNSYVTSPICNISRASIFTGQWASRHGILDFDTDFSPTQLAQTYPVLLHRAGFRTGFIGKFGVGDNPPASAFDYWKGFAGQGVYETTDSAGNPIHLTKLMSEQAISFLRSQPRSKPFMLSVSFKSPHPQDEDARQFIPDPADMGLYAGITMPTPATGSNAYWNALPDFFRQNNEARGRWLNLFATPDMYQTSVKNYY